MAIRRMTDWRLINNRKTEGRTQNKMGGPGVRDMEIQERGAVIKDRKEWNKIFNRAKKKKNTVFNGKCG